VIVHTEEEPSERVVDQRLRNRMMDALAPLVDGNAGVHRAGVADYFEDFFALIEEDRPTWREVSSLTHNEVSALEAVSRELSIASDETPRMIDEASFIASGWPIRIQPQAAAALTLMERRGRFSEDVEESEPSPTAP
jgi:hypothetical protein